MEKINVLHIDVGVFAYNEANNIRHIIEAINNQDIFKFKNFSVKVYILANGCTDETVKISKASTEEEGYTHFEVIDLALGGKSRTWNRFVHEFSRDNADQLIFCDSDIWFTKESIFRELSNHLTHNPALSAVSSRPIKDITLATEKLTFTDKIIASSGDGLNNWKKSICGQLYILNSTTAKSIYLPIGLPVEDGYIRAMIVTTNLSNSENLSKISGDDDIFHFYRSERTIRALINHQTRLVIGSAINYQIFNKLRSNNLTLSELVIYTKSLAGNEVWLTELIESKLPTLHYGWVPWHFLIKRIKYSFATQQTVLNPKKLLRLILGFGFDLVVFIKAQYKMSKGKGVGYW